MNLTLDRIDLQDKYRELGKREILFKHFKPEVQVAIYAAGRGVWYEWGGAEYTAVFPSDEDKKRFIKYGWVLKEANE